MRARSLIAMLALGCVFMAGCRNFRRNTNPPRSYPPNITIPPANIPVGPPPGTNPPIAPPPGATKPPAGNDGSEWLEPQDPPNPGKTKSEYPKRVPADKPDSEKRGAILGDPDYVEPPKNLDDEGSKGDPPPEPMKPDPVDIAKGIADFTIVSNGIASGKRPEIEGLDWLKTKGYKTIVNVRGPKDDDVTDRRQVEEKREMKYVDLVVTPATLTQKWMEDFNRLVAEKASQPVFVYGNAEMIGTIWYLHLRMAQFLTHDEARVRASRLGAIDDKSEWFQAALKIVPKN